MSSIALTFPDGNVKEFPSGITGKEIAKGISQRLGKEALGVFVAGVPHDLATPITKSGEIKIVTWNEDQGKAIFWHSTAHIMAEAIEALFPGTKFGIGPPIEAGFYYDMDIAGAHQLTPDDLVTIEKKIEELTAKRDVPYERIPISWSDAVKYFKEKGDEYKLELLEGFKDQEITLYRQGNFTDLCRGTHVPSTGYLKSVKLMSIAGAYWRGDEKRKMLQRVYGISFPTKKELDDYLIQLEEAKRRDHRKLGAELELFMISPKIGQGLPVWLPKGTIIRETLENFLRTEQRRRGYQPVVTPHIGNLNLYRTSGHFPYYKDSQFTPITLEENEEYLLKPMNCPHHHQIYASRPRSYRELPFRISEFGTVYRYEQSGELNGLTRVRGFTQDDAHIYCTQEGLKEEIKNVIDLTQFVFRTFGMEVSIRLSFRDDNEAKYGGELPLWERAEREIKEVADEMKLEYTIGKGEAAFYGPKIDFLIRDAIGRRWQLGTVQVDYVMPERFDLEYVGADNGKHRPVIIHRAPFGSLERFIGLLIEHYAGNFPMWLAPVQVAVLPISDAAIPYAREVYEILSKAGIRVELDTRTEKIGYKIRDSETKKIPYMAIIGAKEAEARTIAVRKHQEGDKGTFGLHDACELFSHNALPPRV